MILLSTLLTGIAAFAAAFSVLYLLVLLLAALSAGRRVPVPLSATDLPRMVVVIPAHNEELVLRATLASLWAQEYPAEKMRVVVVADNCSDTTAALARSSSDEIHLTVLERFNTNERGKGYALDWAFTQLLVEDDADVYCIVDADTWVAPEFLRRIAAHLPAATDARGYAAVQGRYGVLNRGEGWRAALMTGAFDLVNHVKLLGADRLHLNVGLKGNGMAFTRATLENARWRGHSITEDIDYGLDLLLHHHLRVRYAPDAVVQAQMPTTAAQGASQRSRWEGGRYRLLRERAPSLLTAGLARANYRLIDAGISLIIPPLSEIAALLTVWGLLIALGWAVHLLIAPGVWLLTWGLCVAGFIGYVLGGFAVAGAPRAAYAALLQAPFYALWKFALYAARPRRKSSNGAPEEWVRTERSPVVMPDSAIPIATEKAGTGKD